MEEAVRLSGAHTKTAAVEAALNEYVRFRHKELLLDMSGRVRLEENWRELREAEPGEWTNPGTFLHIKSC